MKSLCRILLFYFIFITHFQHPEQVFGIIEISYATPSASMNSEDEITLDVSLSGATETAEYYLKGVFYLPETTSYFGFTKNHEGNWNESSASPQQHYRIQGNQTVSMSFKPDLTHLGFVGSGPYFFKIGRYTTNGTSITWSQQIPSEIYIFHPTPIPSTTFTPNPTTTTTPQSINNIILSEIFACPLSGATEWVELFNDNDYQVTLTDWSLRDNTATNKKQFTTTIAAKGYGIVEMQSLFNNSGDSVRLVNSQQQEIAQTQYEQCNSQSSIIYHDQQWKETIDITKGSMNQLQMKEEKSPAQFSPISEPKDSSLPYPSLTITKSSELEDTEQLIFIQNEASHSATITGLILGQTFDMFQASDESSMQVLAEEFNSENNTKLWAFVLLGGGLLLLSLSAYVGYQWYNSL